MRRLLIVFTVLVFSAASAFAQAQDRDDHNDNGSILAGYGVVTPVAATTGGTTAGLVVFETFGYRLGLSGVTQAGVLPANLTNNAVLYFNTSGRLGKNTGVAIVNPGSTSASVTITLRKTDGTQLATTTVTVASHQQTSKYITEMFAGQSVPAELSGLATVTSTAPVAVMGLRFRGINFSTLPATSLSGDLGPLPVIATGVGGPGAILLPQFAGGGGWATQIVMANTGTTALTVRVDLFTGSGTPLLAALNGQTLSSFLNLTIPAGGVMTLAPRNQNGDDDF